MRRPKDYHEYKFLDEYKNAKTTLKALHIPCGETVDILPNTFISRGSGCPMCSRKSVAIKQMKSQEQYEKELPDGVYSLEDYKGAFVKIKIHCTKCDNTYKISPHDLKNNGCTRCLGRHKRTLEEVKEEVIKETNGEYRVRSEIYTSTHKPIKVEHLECGNVYEVTRHNFRKGRRCPICSSSKGEKMVSRVLDNQGVSYERQKKFKDLRYANPLSYDFYIPKDNLLIEYQGLQHYEPVTHFGGEEAFKKQQIIDNIKREYARNNNIKLLEIPYTMTQFDDVEDVVIKELKNSTCNTPNPLPNKRVMI